MFCGFVVCLYLVVYFMQCYHVFALITQMKLECGPMPNLLVTLPNIGSALCSAPHSLADAHY